MRADPDAVVIGAGPNGLVAANVLADAGWRVLVLEAQSTPGGAVRSAELAAPGFTADVCSSCYPLGVASPVFRALDLDRYGLRWAHAPLALAHPRPDGCVLVDPADPAATSASIDAGAPGDGAAWDRLYRTWDRAGDEVIAALLAPFPPVRQALRVAARSVRATSSGSPGSRSGRSIGSLASSAAKAAGFSSAATWRTPTSRSAR